MCRCLPARKTLPTPLVFSARDRGLAPPIPPSVRPTLSLSVLVLRSSGILPLLNEAVEVHPVKQQLPQFPCMGKGNPYPLQAASGFEIPYRPGREAEVAGCGR